MRKIRKNIFSLFVMAVFILSGLSSCSQNTSAPASSTAAISMDSNWVFTATFVSPQVGRSGAVNGYYTLTYRDHKLIVYLPYYGRAYGGADVLSGKNPLDFVSTNYHADTQATKKGGSEILFKPTDNSEVSSMNLVWYSNGRANLDIIMANRSAISFTGNLKEIK